MSQAIPLSFDVASLEPGWTGTFPEFLELLPDLISVVADQEFALFVAGATEPPYDSGPWAKNGNEWRYFSEATGDYQPFLIPQISLKYHVGTAEPDADDYLLYFEFVGTTPTSIKGWNGSAWTAFHYLKSELYTKTEIDGLFESYDANGKAQIDWDNVLNKPSSDLYPFAAESAAATAVQANVVAVKLAVVTETYDLGAAYTAASSRFTAAEAGVYRFLWQVQVDNTSAGVAEMTNYVRLTKNGAVNVGSTAENDGDPQGDRWFHSGSVDVALSVGDYVELWGEADSTPSTGFVDFTNIRFSGSLVERT